MYISNSIQPSPDRLAPRVTASTSRDLALVGSDPGLEVASTSSRLLWPRPQAPALAPASSSYSCSGHLLRSLGPAPASSSCLGSARRSPSPGRAPPLASPGSAHATRSWPRRLTWLHAPDRARWGSAQATLAPACRLIKLAQAALIPAIKPRWLQRSVFQAASLGAPGHMS